MSVRFRLLAQFFGVLAQLASVSALHAEGHGFESHRLHNCPGLYTPSLVRARLQSLIVTGGSYSAVALCKFVILKEETYIRSSK